MMLTRPFAAAVIASSMLVALPALTRSQSSADDQQPAYTFHAGARVVLTDVTVTDKHGNPIHGLKASNFEIDDNGKPQSIASFREHTTQPVASLPSVSTAPGTYSNAFLNRLPPALSIIVLDTTYLEIPDQMYLAYQLTRFIKTLPPGQPVAVYWTTGPTSFLLQSFTTDRSMLLAAVHQALPHFPPTGRQYYDDFTTLHKIAVDFGQYPGRKNVLWFSGGSTLYLKPDPDNLPTVADWRTIYDELESDRIAIYPVDARGLMVLGPRTGFSLWEQHVVMNDIAETTGGHAYYDTNGFSQAAGSWLRTGGDFYTITYSPADLQADNRWHTVHIKLRDNGKKYHLSYRRGYFADENAGFSPRSPHHPKPIRIAGETVARPDLHSIPLLFQARVVTASKASSQPAGNLAPPEKGTLAYTIHYTLPLSEFTPKAVNGKQHFELGVAAFSFDENGATITRLGTRFTFDVSEVTLRQSPNAMVPFDQRVNLRKGRNYLYLAVWDMHSGRLGTLQIPFQTEKPAPYHK